MTNVTWFPVLQNNNNLQPMSWNYTHTIQLTTQINPNHNYTALARDFFEKYGTESAFNIANTEIFYASDTCVSLHLHQFGNNTLFELPGFTNFKNKLNELGVYNIKYMNLVPTAQPVGKNSVLLNIIGQCEIRNKIYVIDSTVVIKIDNNSIKITNQIFNLFL